MSVHPTCSPLPPCCGYNPPALPPDPPPEDSSASIEPLAVVPAFPSRSCTFDTVPPDAVPPLPPMAEDEVDDALNPLVPEVALK